MTGPIMSRNWVINHPWKLKTNMGRLQYQKRLWHEDSSDQWMIIYDDDRLWWWSFIIMIIYDDDHLWWWSFMMMIIYDDDHLWWWSCMMMIIYDDDHLWCNDHYMIVLWSLYDHYMTIIWSLYDHYMISTDLDLKTGHRQIPLAYHSSPPFSGTPIFFPSDIPSIISRYLPGWLVSYPPFSCVPHIHSSLLSSPFLINQTLPPCQPVNPYMFHEKNPSCFMRKIGSFPCRASMARFNMKSCRRSSPNSSSSGVSSKLGTSSLNCHGRGQGEAQKMEDGMHSIGQYRLFFCCQSARKENAVRVTLNAQETC